MRVDMQKRESYEEDITISVYISRESNWVRISRYLQKSVLIWFLKAFLLGDFVSLSIETRGKLNNVEIKVNIIENKEG